VKRQECGSADSKRLVSTPYRSSQSAPPSITSPPCPRLLPRPYPPPAAPDNGGCREASCGRVRFAGLGRRRRRGRGLAEVDRLQIPRQGMNGRNAQNPRARSRAARDRRRIDISTSTLDIGTRLWSARHPAPRIPFGIVCAKPRGCRRSGLWMRALADFPRSHRRHPGLDPGSMPEPLRHRLRHGSRISASLRPG
jgi:hypothetical protein